MPSCISAKPPRCQPHQANASSTIAAAASRLAPKWNFYKYVVDRRGKVIANFSSLTKPDDPEFKAAIEKAIASQP